MMSNRWFMVWFILLAQATVCTAQPDAARRTESVRQELRGASNRDGARLGRLKMAVRAEVLRRLNSAQWKDSTLLRDLAPTLTGEWSGPLSLIRGPVNGSDVVILGYTIDQGAGARPDAAMAIDAYRKVGDRYEWAAEAGDEFAGSHAKLELLTPPWTDEMWLLCHGQQTGAMQDQEQARVYSFDGQHFKDLWASGQPLRQPAFEIDDSEVSITFGEAGSGRPMILTLALVPQGPMEVSLMPKQ
jgi:hypothetical protein